MNTLRDKIKTAIKEIVYADKVYTRSEGEKLFIDGEDEAAKVIQSIAEDFAVKFAEWLNDDFKGLGGDIWESMRGKDFGNIYHRSELLTEFRDNFYSPNIKEGENGRSSPN